VDHALYVGTNNKHYFQVHGLKEEQLHFAPHAVTTQRFADPDPAYCEEAKALRQRLGIRDEDLLVLFAGKLEPKKDPFFLMELCSRINSGNLNFYWSAMECWKRILKRLQAGNERILFMDFRISAECRNIQGRRSVILPSKVLARPGGLAVE